MVRISACLTTRDADYRHAAPGPCETSVVTHPRALRHLRSTPDGYGLRRHVRAALAHAGFRERLLHAHGVGRRDAPGPVAGSRLRRARFPAPDVPGLRGPPGRRLPALVGGRRRLFADRGEHRNDLRDLPSPRHPALAVPSGRPSRPGLSRRAYPKPSSTRPLSTPSCTTWIARAGDRSCWSRAQPPWRFFFATITARGSCLRL
jgi:hypothetical protein